MKTIYTHKELGNNGRLGNQLWQIAATLSTAKNNNTKAKFPHWPNAILFKNQIDQSFNHQEMTHQYSEPWFHYSEIGEEHTYLIKHDTEKRIVNLHGYFQSERYFEHCKDYIKEQFEFSDFLKNSCNSIIKDVKQTNPNKTIVSLHLRFGDYVNNPFYTQLTQNGYYERAAEYLANNFDDILYIVFSDDKEKASEYMETLHAYETQKVKYIIIGNTNEGMDFCLMSLCDHNVIANSSFSWWASYLNKNIHKKIIAPRNWFGKDTVLDTKDLYTKEMIIL